MRSVSISPRKRMAGRMKVGSVFSSTTSTRKPLSGVRQERRWTVRPMRATRPSRSKSGRASRRTVTGWPSATGPPSASSTNPSPFISLRSGMPRSFSPCQTESPTFFFWSSQLVR